jgi:hypothetical protein
MPAQRLIPFADFGSIETGPAPCLEFFRGTSTAGVCDDNQAIEVGGTDMDFPKAPEICVFGADREESRLLYTGHRMADK